MFLFTNISKFSGKPVLCCMFGGHFAADIEKYSDNAIVDRCVAALKGLYGKKVQAPVDYYVTRWKADPFARGSFCFVPPLCNEEEHRHLAEPLCDSSGDLRVLFAGEHTCGTHPSTIHGAFLSGIREAYRLDLTYEKVSAGELSSNEMRRRQF